MRRQQTKQKNRTKTVNCDRSPGSHGLGGSGDGRKADWATRWIAVMSQEHNTQVELNCSVGADDMGMF